MQVTVNILGSTRVETIHGNQCTRSGYPFAQERELTGYGTQKRVSYEVQPTSDHVQKSIREVCKCQKKAEKYVI